MESRLGEKAENLENLKGKQTHQAWMFLASWHFSDGTPGGWEGEMAHLWFGKTFWQKAADRAANEVYRRLARYSPCAEASNEIAIPCNGIG